MYGAFIIISFASLMMQPPGTACFKFFITRDLNSAMQLEKTKWTHVEVITSEESVTVKFDIPGNLLYSDAFVFFANDTKAILEVKLERKVRGKFYAVPYNLIGEMEAEETNRIANNDFREVSGSFPRKWLPERCNKVSAAVVAESYFNYYKLQNFKISLPDVMVVEEYMQMPDPIKN